MASSSDDLHKAYDEYASKKDQMTTKDVTMWLTHAGLLKKSGNFCSNNIDIKFSSCKTKGKTTITFEQFQTLLDKLEATPAQREKIAGTSKEGNIKGTKQSKSGGVDRMTDTSKYTGSHAQRFDETGKGKGAEGRVDKADTSGYVGNYKGEGSYEKK